MKVSELMNPAGVRLYANIKEAADVLGILVELQEETGAITNGTAYYNAVCQRGWHRAAPRLQRRGIGPQHFGPDAAPRRGLGCPGRPGGGPFVHDRRAPGK